MSLFLLQGRLCGEYFRIMVSTSAVMRWILSLSFSVSLLGSGFLFGQEKNPWGDWHEAKTYYDAEKFSDALKAFQDHPRSDASYYYNLGSVYFKLGKLGEALAYLEKANRLHPHEPDIQYNLALVRNMLSRSIGAEHLDPASTWAEQAADRLSPDEVRTAVGLLGLILILLWIRTYWVKRDLVLTLRSSGGLIVLVGLSAALAVFGIHEWGRSCPPVISLQRQSIRSGPGEHFLELAQVEEGSKLRLLGPSSTSSKSSETSQGEKPDLWQQVRYSADGVGWVKSSGFLML